MRDRISFAMFSAGSTLGLRAPDCAKEPLALWTLFIWVVMWVRFTRRGALGRSEDLTGLRSFCACHAFLSKCPVFDHACCLPHSAKQNGLRYVPFLFRRGSGSLFARSRMSRGYRALLVHFGLARFFMAIPTENEGTGERGERRERRTESAARQSAFLRDRISFAMFSAGSPLGAECGSRTAAAPQTAPKSHWLSGLSSFGS